MLQPFITPVLSRFISARLFSLPQVENADFAEIHEAVTDKLKKFQKEEFSAAFQKLYDLAKACIYANGTYFEFKKVCVFLMCLRFKKKFSPKILDRTAYILATSTAFTCLNCGVLSASNTVLFMYIDRNVS